jgi:Rrf2 family protein
VIPPFSNDGWHSTPMGHRGMVITTTGEYALRAAMHLARRHPAAVTCAEIAEQTHVPPSYLYKIMQALVKNRLAHSQRGFHGGFQLTASPEQITVMDILDAAGAPPQGLPTEGAHEGSDGRPLSLQRLVSHAAGLVESAFVSASLAGLLNELEVPSAAERATASLGESDPCDPWHIAGDDRRK